MDSITPQQMLEWLDTQMGIEQSKGPWTDRTREHDLPFFRLKAIYDFIRHHAHLDTLEAQQKPMRSAESWADSWDNGDFDNIIALISAIQQDAARSPAVGEWRPMLEAPKDGRPILACWRYKNGEWIGVIHWQPGEKQWKTYGANSRLMESGDLSITHWQPLPLPPLKPAGAP